MFITVDNGHGVNTPGKRSPDGRFREYAYARAIASAVVQHLQYRGYDAGLLVPEEEDIPLKERGRRVNELCGKYGKENCCLVSIHVNAAGMGDRWYNATGWSCYSSKGQTPGDKLADALCIAAAKYVHRSRMRTDFSDGDADLEANFYLLRHTACAAVLTENFYMDNQDDLAFLESEEGLQAIVGLHVEGIINYVRYR